MKQKPKWHPKVGERYWTINISLGVMSLLQDEWSYNYWDHDRYKSGNVFRTKRLALAKIRKIKEVMRG